jgi:Domain of unknown function (DUF6894)
MKRYFFDVTRKSGAEYDYRGREFASPEQALEMAKLIALDLEICPQIATEDSTINVRDCYGKQFFSMPVRTPELLAA